MERCKCRTNIIIFIYTKNYETKASNSKVLTLSIFQKTYFLQKISLLKKIIVNDRYILRSYDRVPNQTQVDEVSKKSDGRFLRNCHLNAKSMWSPADSNPRRRSFEWKIHEIELDSNPCLDRPQTSIFKPTILKTPSLNKYYKNIAHTILFAAGANSCTCFVARSDRTFLTWHSLERFYCIDIAVR